MDSSLQGKEPEPPKCGRLFESGLLPNKWQSSAEFRTVTSEGAFENRE